MHALQARLSGPVAGSRPTMAIPWLPGSCVSNLQKFTRHVILAMPDAAVRPGAGEDAADQQNPVRQEQQQAARGYFKLTKRHRPLSFYKWQKKLYMQLLELEQEQALLAAPGSDEWYYSYWDCPDAHLPVLQDKPYQAAWAAAFDNAGPAVFKDKVVLDVGCGLGTLAIAAAKAGAKHVYAVDASPGAADLARKVVAANGLSNRITVITGRAELVQLPVRQNTVDVIISDWMGSMLLHDGLLPALIRARDKWLSPGGVILPDIASLHVMAVDDRQYLAEQSKLWSGGQLGPGEPELKPVLNGVIRHPRLDSISRRAQLVTDRQQLLELDLYKATLQDMTVQRDFTLTAQRDERVSGLLTYFDTSFTCRGRLEQPVTFTTSPLAPSTSWLQLVFSFPRAIKMETGQQLLGSFNVAPVGAPIGRMLTIDVDINFQGMKAQVAYQLKR